MELEKLKVKLLNTFIEFSKASNEFNSKKGNRAYDKITKLYGLLKEQYIEDVPDILSELVKNEDNNIVLFSATYLLEFKPIEAEEILKKMLNKDGIVSLNAEYTLIEWEKGTLMFPPF